MNSNRHQQNRIAQPELSGRVYAVRDRLLSIIRICVGVIVFGSAALLAIFVFGGLNSLFGGMG